MTEQATPGPTLELRDVVKSFGPVTALRSGSLVAEPGSIHALVGENGAGKSTLVKIVAGVYRRDAGTFRFRGEDVDFHSTAESKAEGIAVIYQEPTLFPDLSVTENIFMGRQPHGRAGRIDRARMYAEAEALFQRLGVAIDPRREARGLSIADQQIIEIAKAISLDASLLIMDEPTAALSGVEVERLFAVARSLRDEGRALVFISHRFDEVFDLCDKVTVLRDGSYVDTLDIAESSVDQIVSLMVGREVSDLYPKTEATVGDVVLDVQVDVDRLFRDVDLQVRSGEIVGLAGLVGAEERDRSRHLRRRQVRRRLGPPPRQGRAGAQPAGRDPSRDGSGARGPAPAGPGGGELGGPQRGRRDSARSGSLRAAHLRSREQGRCPLGLPAEVKTSALDMAATTMSGGNQQKVVIAKWLATRPQLLIIDEPTRGIDVGTKAEVHRLLSDLAGQGIAILMISSELPEVLGMADRVLVVCEGQVTAEFARADATPEAVMHAATHVHGHVAGATHVDPATEPGDPADRQEVTA